MNDLNLNNRVKIILNIIIGLSAGAFTVGISINNDKYLIIISAIISILYCIYLMIKKDMIDYVFKKTTVIDKCISLYFSIRIVYEFLKKLIDFSYINKYLITMGSFIFMFIILSIIVSKLRIYIVDFINNMDKFEKIYYLTATVIIVLVISITYSMTNGFYKQYDVIYSIDAGYVSNKIFPKLYYFDIRHSFLSVITFPIWRLFKDIEIILGCNNGLAYILLGILNSQILIVSGILLKRLTKSKWILIIYSISNPFIIYSLMIEKYQICTILLVIFAYATIHKNNELQDQMLIFGIGSMTTSAAMGVFCGKSNKIKEIIFNYFKVIVKFLLTLIILGRISVLTDGINMVSKTMDKFGGKMEFQNRLYASIDLIKSCFIAPKYVVVEKGLYWESIGNTLDLFGVFILCMLIVSFIVCRKNKFAQICGYWTGISFFIFLVLGWSVHESPLFSLYFSWAIISLLIMGIENIFINNQKFKKVILSLASIIMIAINISHIMFMIKYLMMKFPA